MREVRRNLGLCYPGNCRRLVGIALFHGWTLPASLLFASLARKQKGPLGAKGAEQIEQSNTSQFENARRQDHDASAAGD